MYFGIESVRKKMNPSKNSLFNAYGIEAEYMIVDKDGTAISKEFCGGPHIEHTGVLGKFKISKEESVASGVRRIKAVLE